MPALYVGCADNIAHADKTAMGAFENPSAWRVPLAAYRACLAGKFFVHIVENGDTFGLGFVADIFTHSATPSSPAQCRTCRVRQHRDAHTDTVRSALGCIGTSSSRRDWVRDCVRPIREFFTTQCVCTVTCRLHRDTCRVAAVRGDWVLTLPMKAFAVCNISNIADSYLSDTVFKAPVDHCATDLVTE